MPIVSFYGYQTAIQVPEGSLLIDALHAVSYPVNAPCGGHGKCGKCKITVLNGSAPGIYPSCSFVIKEDISILLPDSREDSQILASGKSLPEAGLPDSIMRRGYKERHLFIRKEETPVYVLAFDIGTTTVVSYLLNARTGCQVCVSSMLNPQTAYGGDVVSRSEYDVSHQDGKLTDLIRAALCTLTKENIEKAGIGPEDIYFAVIVGNTCMQHLYLGVSPESLIHVPYTATVDELQMLSAVSLGLPVHPKAQAAVFPAIAGFVGGDTVSVLLSLPDSAVEELTLILDIGTNGELVLAKNNCRYTCSTAAGPAFEGARISCGMRGAKGAVDHVSVKNGVLHFTTIGQAPPIGICGSGLIDLIRCLLELQILSARGRIEKPSKWPEQTRALYQHRITKRDGVTAFLLTDDPDGVYLTQKDIREVQLAKAAIAAGIDALCEAMDVCVADIRSVLLAGAFGNYLSPESACRIGLIPPILLDRIQGIGNAAGEGAKLAALFRDALEAASSLAKETNFLELASLPGFQELYLSHLNF